MALKKKKLNLNPTLRPVKPTISAFSCFYREIKYSGAILIFVISVIISCDKKNNSVENPVTSPLYGSWRMIGSVVSGCTDPSSNHNLPDCCASGGLCCGNTVEFTRTTMTTFSSIFGTRSSSYTISGNAYHYPSDGGLPTIFAITDTILTLTYQQSAGDGGCLIVDKYFRN